MSMDRVANFGAGPGVLPLSVLQEVQEKLLNLDGAGMSILEMSHRSAQFEAIHSQAIKDLRELMGIPEDYEVLFAQGGATTHFASIPLNLMACRTAGSQKPKALYIVSGRWSEKAAKEASKYLEIVTISSKDGDKFCRLPIDQDWECPDDESLQYVYYCANETVDGVQFPFIPKVPNHIPLVCDVSSEFLSKPVEVSKFGIIFGGAQKNIGPAGLVILIVRKNLLGHSASFCPTMLDLKTLAQSNSLYNTPPSFAIYVAGLVFKWLKDFGGLERISKVNEEKARVLYDAIESTKKLECMVDPSCRSVMNVVWQLKDEFKALEKELVSKAKSRGLVCIKGHRSVGGFRASLYNAQSLENVHKLAELIREFDNSS